MRSENKPEYVRIKNDPVLILGLILSAVILVMICCILSAMLFDQLRGPRSTAQEELPVLLTPTAALPAATPTNQFSIYLPITLYKIVSVPAQVWKVTNIKNQGYELNGQRRDLATFTRSDDPATAQGYCINPGWDVPAIGTEYLLNAEGVFIPVHRSDTHPLQRFLRFH